MSARHILGTFDLRPSRLAAISARPDELMIDWTSLPAGALAKLYVPSLSTETVRATAAQLYGWQPFTLVDGATLGCAATGITFVPLPAGIANIAGLLDVTVPQAARPGSKCTIACSQITNAAASVVERGHRRSPVLGPPANATGAARRWLRWRKEAGSFKLALLVRDARDELPRLSQRLSLLLWMQQGIPPQNRWHPILRRYLEALSADILAAGGNPDAIQPSSSGLWQDPGHGPCLTGKIDGLVFDHFGDFEGFILEDEEGQRHRFDSRAWRIEAVVNRAWAERLRVAVETEGVNARRVRGIILLKD